jgi:hypothetical protein
MLREEPVHQDEFSEAERRELLSVVVKSLIVFVRSVKRTVVEGEPRVVFGYYWNTPCGNLLTHLSHVVFQIKSTISPGRRTVLAEHQRKEEEDCGQLLAVMDHDHIPDE